MKPWPACWPNAPKTGSNRPTKSCTPCSSTCRRRPSTCRWSRSARPISTGPGPTPGDAQLDSPGIRRRHTGTHTIPELARPPPKQVSGRAISRRFHVSGRALATGSTSAAGAHFAAHFPIARFAALPAAARLAAHIPAALSRWFSGSPDPAGTPTEGLRIAPLNRPDGKCPVLSTQYSVPNAPSDPTDGRADPRMRKHRVLGIRGSALPSVGLGSTRGDRELGTEFSRIRLRKRLFTALPNRSHALGPSPAMHWSSRTTLRGPPSRPVDQSCGGHDLRRSGPGCPTRSARS